MDGLTGQRAQAGAPRRLLAWLDGQIGGLFPGCFALVMATGIISNTLYLEAHRALSDALFAVNAAAYPWLLLLTALRALRFQRALWTDLTNPGLVFSFFTLVAASDVLGLGFELRGHDGSAAALWAFALAAWLLLIYFSFAVLTFLNTARGANVVHGGWLIAIVGTESLVILGTAVAPGQGALAASIFVLIHMLWGIGLGLYGIFITLFAYRIFFFDVRPDDVTPQLWVVMGAAAISVNAGCTLIVADTGLSYLAAMRPFIEGVTLVLWPGRRGGSRCSCCSGYGSTACAAFRCAIRQCCGAWCFRLACTRWPACGCRLQRSLLPCASSPRR